MKGMAGMKIQRKRKSEEAEGEAAEAGGGRKHLKIHRERKIILLPSFTPLELNSHISNLQYPNNSH